jgi:hypothetical protein
MAAGKPVGPAVHEGASGGCFSGGGGAASLGSGKGNVGGRCRAIVGLVGAVGGCGVCQVLGSKVGSVVACGCGGGLAKAFLVGLLKWAFMVVRFH